MPTLRRLQVFAEAAADCNFRKTADRLGMTQAGLSNHIILLERELGYQLFERRRGSTPRLAPAGAGLLEQVRVTLESASSFIKPHDVAGPGVACYSLAVRNFLLQTRIVPAIPAFLEQNPEIDLNFESVDRTEDILELVTSGECDLGLFRGPVPRVPYPFRAEVICQSTSFLFAGRALAEDARERGLSLVDLPFVLPKTGTQLCVAVEQALRDVGIVPKNVVARSQFAETLANWIVEGRGISALYMEHMYDLVLSGCVVRVGPPLGEWNTVMVSKSDLSDPRFTRVMEFLRTMLNNPYAQLERVPDFLLTVPSEPCEV